MRWCARIARLGLLGLLACAPRAARGEAALGGAPQARAVSASTKELSTRISALRRSEALDDSVRRPLELAESALERASTRAQAHDVAGTERARQVASAALELAEARLLLLRERALERAARARREDAAARLEVAAQALARERQRADELEQASSTP